MGTEVTPDDRGAQTQLWRSCALLAYCCCASDDILNLTYRIQKQNLNFFRLDLNLLRVA
jgi:hypothetical protein